MQQPGCQRCYANCALICSVMKLAATGGDVYFVRKPCCVPRGTATCTMRAKVIPADRCNVIPGTREDGSWLAWLIFPVLTDAVPNQWSTRALKPYWTGSANTFNVCPSHYAFILRFIINSCYPIVFPHDRYSTSANSMANPGGGVRWVRTNPPPPAGSRCGGWKRLNWLYQSSTKRHFTETVQWTQPDMATRTYMKGI